MTPAYEKAVEVLNVQRSNDALTGDSLYQVTFGELANVDDDLRRYLPASPGGRPPKKLQILTLTLFFKFKNEAPYRAGQKCLLTIGEDGKLTLNTKQ